MYKLKFKLILIIIFCFVYTYQAKDFILVQKHKIDRNFKIIPKLYDNNNPTSIDQSTNEDKPRISTFSLQDCQLSSCQIILVGALSKSLAQVMIHPFYTYKTMIQSNKFGYKPQGQLTLLRLFQGVDAQFILSLPHGALHFIVLEQVHILYFYILTISELFSFIFSLLNTVDQKNFCTYTTKIVKLYYSIYYKCDKYHRLFGDKHSSNGYYRSINGRNVFQFI